MMNGPDTDLVRTVDVERAQRHRWKGILREMGMDAVLRRRASA
jgi:hypothetical protein